MGQDTTMKNKPSLAIAALAAALLYVGCRADSVQAKEEPDPTLPSAPLQEFTGLFDKWERFHGEKLVATAKEMEERYLELKKNPPQDPQTGKPRVIRPGDGIYGGRRASFNGRPVTPAVSTFGQHISGLGGGLIGGISVDAARFRLWFEDNNVLGYWMFFRYQPGKDKAPFQRFEDAVGTELLPADQFRAFETVVKEAAKKEGYQDSGELHGWKFEVRPLTFLDKSCTTCHTDREQDSLAGLMLYMAARAEQD